MSPALAAAWADHPLVSGLLAALALLFLVGFVGRGLRLHGQLGGALAGLRALPRDDGSGPDAVGRSLSAAGGWIGHGWDEYRKTLYRTGEPGAADARWLATVPAESVWNGPAVVDPRVGAEFFKHLPGVFTGLGIIGTFFGLVNGLQQFRVSADAQEVRVSLEALMAAVGGAFTVSAVAIGLAMAVTVVEKLLLGALHRRTDRLAEELDRRFAAEPAERFLEAGARHTARTADGVDRLPQALQRLLQPALAEMADQNARTLVRLTGTLQSSLAQASERQIAAGQAQCDQLQRALADTIEQGVGRAVGEAVGSAVAESLRGPVSQALGQAVAEAVQVSVSTALSGALQTALAEPLDRVAQALQHTAREQGETTLRELAESLDRFGERLERLLAAQAGALGTEFSGLSSQLVASLAQGLGEARAQQEARERALQERATALIGGLAEEQRERGEAQSERLVTAVQALLRQSSVADERLQQTVAALSSLSRSAIGGLGDGAQQVQAASRQFAAAADRAGAAMAQVADWGGRLDATGRQLAEAAAALQQGVVDYQGHREQVGRMVGELHGLLGQARREASLSTEVLQRIEGAARALGRSQLQAEAFLGGVADVLGQAHEAFGQAMLRTVGQQGEAFQQQLNTAVGQLAATVEQLDDALGALVPPVRGP